LCWRSSAIFSLFSAGFRINYAKIGSLVAVLGAFAALSQAVKGIDLSVARALGWVRHCRDPGGELDPLRPAPE
jgi:hypothetical protein